MRDFCYGAFIMGERERERALTNLRALARRCRPETVVSPLLMELMTVALPEHIQADAD